MSVHALWAVMPTEPAPMKSWRRVMSTNGSVCSTTRMFRISRFPRRESSAPVDCGVRRFSITSGHNRRERISRDRHLLEVGGVAGGVTNAIFCVAGTECLLKGQKKHGATETRQARQRGQLRLHTDFVSELHTAGGPGVACQGTGINKASLDQVSENCVP